MKAADLAGLSIPLLYFVMLAAETRWPARPFPPRRSWRWLGLAFLALIMTLGAVVPLLMPLDWMSRHRWIDGSALGVAAGTLAGWFVLSGVNFAYHRAAHAVPLLWRIGHQIHHSPQRVDISGSVLFHPFEMAVQVVLQLFVTVIVLGLAPPAAALTGAVAAFYGLFQHWNVRTPTWLGYLIQRPEAHCVHHRMGLHAFNYGDLPWWDMLFGTFRNPREFRGACGFEAPADGAIAAMLVWQDVNEPFYGRGSRGASTTGGAAAATAGPATSA